MTTDDPYSWANAVSAGTQLCREAVTLSFTASQ